MNGFHRFPRRLSAVLLVSLGAGAAQAQLNDTGQDRCYDGGANLVKCTTANTGDAAPYRRQDARFGRDAAATAGVLPKTGGGAAGFDFTKVCMSGELAGQGSCPANPSVGTGPNDWACTKDNHTNLIWSLDSPTYNWTDATTTYPAAMNATNRCGYNTDWRAPTRRELLSIVRNGTYNPAIDANYFPNTVSSYYWSADTYASDPSSFAWRVDFGSGGSTWNFDINDDDHVRLVRSEVPLPPGVDFTDNLDGTVTDERTGLMWDKCSWGQIWTGAPPNTNTCTGRVTIENWDTALARAVTANNNTHRGYNDWRLPSKNELESLVDRSEYNPAIDTTAFPNTPAAAYWSSTTFAPNPALAWGVYFGIGNTSISDKGDDIHVRLVRSGQSFDDFDLFPLKATLIAPKGTITDNMPTYQWNAVANAAKYYLKVQDGSGTVKIGKWYTAAQAGCGAGTGICAVTPDTVLAEGAAKWWIRTWNKADYGPWSAVMNFKVVTIPPPAATLIAPTGAITDNTPTYQWNAVANAAKYYLKVKDGSGTVKIGKWYTAAQAGCGAGTGTCAVTPGTALANGAGQWSIRTWNAAGYGLWSGPLAFTLSSPE